MRCGLITKKVGMSSFSRDGQVVPITLLAVESSQVVEVKTVEKHGYSAVVVAYGKAGAKKVHKAQRVAFEKQGLDVQRSLKEFRVSKDDALSVGETLDIQDIRDQQCIDVIAVTSGKGFAGGMKRHNFGGLRASHGVSVSHRALGSTGQCQDPGRVFKGKKMAGHMGGDRVTIKNLKVLWVDSEKQVLGVLGSVPGKPGGTVIIRDAWKERDHGKK